MTDGVLERTGEVEAHCEQRENESHDTEREKTFGRKESRQRGETVQRGSKPRRGTARDHQKNY